MYAPVRPCATRRRQHRTARDVASYGIDQKPYGAGDIGGDTEPTDRRAVRDDRAGVTSARRAPPCCIVAVRGDGACAFGVNGNPVLGQFGRHDLGHPMTANFDAQYAERAW